MATHENNTTIAESDRDKNSLSNDDFDKKDPGKDDELHTVATTVSPRKTRR
jgi:hypothetical protein